ncbi:MAG: KH domain-containing protein [Anaerolineales bacterium]|nr:KH domain-containing protein [Anaerolineales bacterium]MCL4257043.1 KH domain-containing protein [Anaerolineales bacterium]QYK51575.1 MAG: KH domain-containing protein [Anaerolineales bacterium]
MKELVEYIAGALVDDPTQVRVNQRRRGEGTELSLLVGKEDMGRIIGRNGRVANAIRLLLQVAASQDGKQATLHISEPD